ncbi:MAG TPA: nucleoside-diphosphate sugar epimerase/dehydratase [Flavipsychrobacter sp.]|jgi:FlaA1/EpsC-like NDP-sugar epimerase|nr:nucleoside-diphosphate sugar epimerase/dehydratase [Flavipsychrobacter sp.]
MKKPIKTLPKGIVYFFDMACVLSCLYISQIFRYNFNFEGALQHWEIIAITAVTINSLLFFLFKTYHGIVRYTTVVDSFKIITINLITASVYILVKLGLEQYGLYNYGYKIGFIAFVSIFVNFFIVSFALIGYRTLVRHIYETYFSRLLNANEYVKVVIYDASEYGIAAKRMISDNAYVNMQVVAFLDDDPNKKNKLVEGLPIKSTDEISIGKLKAEGVQTILISRERMSNKVLNNIVDIALKYGIKVQQVPPINKWLQGKTVTEQIKNINIEDLLERDIISIKNEKVYKELSSKIILVTGAAGSIGSEIVRQVMRYKPSLLILCDKAESPLHELLLEIEEQYGSKNVKAFIADICDATRMEQLFDVYNPEVIYHVAAYKHVPLMELNPSVAVLNNVLGTKILAELAVAYLAEKFVMVSTDKAVNPTNVMGASKRIAEIFTQSYFKHFSENGNDTIQRPQTKFVTTRFGNVLGSNGSVIPRFKKQIEQGGPITITHPDITRYFMTIPEACQLVIEAGVMGNGGEIFVFDMGKPVKIVDLANKMIQLSGKIPDIDIKTVFTGLRPGEKLYEELLNNAENSSPTYHEKIMIAQVREYDFLEVNNNIEALIALAHKHYTMETVKLMKEIVPEFVSNNSVYEKLDKK